MQKYDLHELVAVRDQILRWLHKGRDIHCHMTDKMVRINEEHSCVEVKFHTYFYTYYITASPDGFMASLSAVDPLMDRKFCGGRDMTDSSEFNEENWNVLMTEFVKTVIIGPEKHLIDVLKERMEKRKKVWRNKKENNV